MIFSIDLELTNRCNASCHFCPRDRTPHQGLMSPETFDQALQRAIEYRAQVREAFAPEPVDVQISLCGLGEPLLNKHTPEFVRKVREAGFHCSLSSNAALLDERRANAVLDAGVQLIHINIGDIDEAYEEVYKLPFEKTRDNILRFAELAEGRCEVCVVLVDYRADREHVEAMKAYWRGYGIDLFEEFEIMNRGGSLFVDHMQYEAFPELATAEQLLRADDAVPLCGAPFAFLFVGYDSNYYLCCSDWEKQVPLGSVFDESFLDVTAAKLHHVVDRRAVCKTCNLDPINRLTEALQDRTAGRRSDAEVDQLTESMRAGSLAIKGGLETLRPGITSGMADLAPKRRLIPVRGEL